MLYHCTTTAAQSCHVGNATLYSDFKVKLHLGQERISDCLETPGAAGMIVKCRGPYQVASPSRAAVLTVPTAKKIQFVLNVHSASTPIHENRGIGIAEQRSVSTLP